MLLSGPLENPRLVARTGRSRLSMLALALAVFPLMWLAAVRLLGVDSALPLEALGTISLVCMPLALVLGIVAVVRHRGAQRPGVGVAALAVVIGGAELGAFFLLLPGLGGAHGRALRVRGRPALPPVDTHDLSHETAPALELDALPREDRDALAVHWTLVAREEHASILAFERLAAALAAHDAPRSLIAGARVAARQEADHADRCFALASAFAGRTLTPAAWHPDAEPTPSLVRLALEALLDGCLGEGIAAAEAATLVAGRATVDAVHDTLVVIRRDEAGHAELSWSVLAWCLAVGGEALHTAVRRALATLREAPAPATDAAPGASLRRFGVPTASEHEVAWRGTVDATVARAHALLPTRLTHAA